MPKLLFVSYYFPPLGGVASIRGLKFVKYLSAKGYDITVLTVIPQFMKHPKDKALIGEIPQQARVLRAFCPDPNWLFKLLWGMRLNSLVKFIRQRILIPDPEVLWLPFAKRKLRKELASGNRYDLALISSGPPSALFLGLELKNRHQISFICDFRDEWTNNPERINLDYPASTQSRELILEASILMASAGVVYLTPIMRQNFEHRYPFMLDKANQVIPNGFDESDFKGLSPEPGDECFTLLYCGSFYDRRQPDPLWKAIKDLIIEGVINPNRFRVRIIGKNTPSFVMGAYVNDPRIYPLIRFEGFQPHRKTLQAMLGADALLLYIPSGLNTDSVLTGKIFDYLRAGKPILGVVPPGGMAAEIIRKARVGFIADHSDGEGIKARLTELYRLWQKNELQDLNADRAYVSSFSRQEQATRLSYLIASILERSLA